MTTSAPGSLPHDGPPPGVAAGDVAAFWGLAEQLRAYLKSVAARVLGEQLAAKTDPSSVVQRGLLAALQNLPQLQGQDESAWRAWLVQIVRNEALNLVRHHHQAMRDVRRERPLEAGSHAGPQVAADGSSPSEQAARREQAMGMLAAIDRLAPDHRQVLELRHVQDLPFAEIATRMGRSPEAVRQLWVRAVDQLREKLGVQA